MKKAQGIQFNWIFIIVTGAIILAFFSLFLVRYTDLQQKKANAEIGVAIDDTLNALKSDDIYLPLELTNLNIEFSCDDFIINNDFIQDMGDKIVFSEAKLNGKEISTWVKSWNFPFRVDNFIYLADPKTTYYLVYGSNKEEVEFIKNEIPDIFNIEVISLSEVNQVKKTNSKFIFFTQPNLDKDFVRINLENNEVEFEDGSSFFFEDAMLYGAIFSSNLENYNCGFEKAVTKLDIISNIYAKKASTLQECNYNSIIQNLKQFSDLTKNPSLELINIKEEEI